LTRDGRTNGLDERTIGGERGIRRREAKVEGQRCKGDGLQGAAARFLVRKLFFSSPWHDPIRTGECDAEKERLRLEDASLQLREAFRRFSFFFLSSLVLMTCHNAGLADKDEALLMWRTNARG